MNGFFVCFVVLIATSIDSSPDVGVANSPETRVSFGAGALLRASFNYR